MKNKYISKIIVCISVMFSFAVVVYAGNFDYTRSTATGGTMSGENLARELIIENFDMISNMLANSVDDMIISAENLSLGEGFPLLWNRHDIIEAYRSLDNNFKNFIEQDINNWIFIVNNNGSSEFYVTVIDSGNNNLSLASWGGDAREFDDALERFKVKFPNEAIRIYEDRIYHFLSEDYSYMMEIPSNPMQFAMRRGQDIVMDTNIVTEIIMEQIEEEVRRQMAGEPYQFGGSSLAELYQKRNS